jgi:hypothetical protein
MPPSRSSSRRRDEDAERSHRKLATLYGGQAK